MSATSSPVPVRYLARIYRVGDRAGPDYLCSRCALTGHRLWRMGGSSHVELTCATCSEVAQRGQIERYASFTEPHHTTIGDLVPARPDHDQRWFGHTSGEFGWWLRLPQYIDPARELARVRLERDHQHRLAEYYAGEYAKAIGMPSDGAPRLPWAAADEVAAYVQGDGTDAQRLALAAGIRAGRSA